MDRCRELLGSPYSGVVGQQLFDFVLDPVLSNRQGTPSTDNESHSTFINIYQYLAPIVSGALHVVWAGEGFLEGPLLFDFVDPVPWIQ